MPSRLIALCMPYYMNQGMLDEQLNRLRKFPQTVLDRLEVLITDDGSPNGEARAQPIGCPLTLFRIDVDVRWNQDAARNIAAHHATARWLLLTDIDHLVPQSTFEWLIANKLDALHSYRFTRETLDALPDERSPYKPHPNSWFVARDLYWRMGGYDERFAGHYGTDAEFRDRLVKHSGEPEMLDCSIYRVPRSTIADASTTTYVRKGAPEDVGAIQRIKVERGRELDWRPLNLSFPYRRIFP